MLWEVYFNGKPAISLVTIKGVRRRWRLSKGRRIIVWRHDFPFTLLHQSTTNFLHFFPQFPHKILSATIIRSPLQESVPRHSFFGSKLVIVWTGARISPEYAEIVYSFHVAYGLESVKVESCHVPCRDNGQFLARGKRSRILFRTWTSFRYSSIVIICTFSESEAIWLIYIILAVFTRRCPGMVKIFFAK